MLAMARVLRPLFVLLFAGALCAAVAACNTNGGIPAYTGPPGVGTPAPSASPTPIPTATPTKSPTPTPSPTPT
jgi:hypothetical protein